MRHSMPESRTARQPARSASLAGVTGRRLGERTAFGANVIGWEAQPFQLAQIDEDRMLLLRQDGVTALPRGGASRRERAGRQDFDASLTEQAGGPIERVVGVLAETLVQQHRQSGHAR